MWHTASGTQLFGLESLTFQKLFLVQAMPAQDKILSKGKSENFLKHNKFAGA